MEFILMLLLAVTLDFLFGDPPNAFHPVAWMGKVIALLEKPGLKFRPVWQFLYGMDLTILVVALFTIPTWLLLDYLEDYNSIAFVIVGGILLKSTFSYTTLRKVALKIKCLLDKDKLDEARFELRALVSRDTSKLGKPKLVSATVESVAESSGDSFVSPLFFYLIFGVSGAVAFRVVSTLDSMIGYRGRYEYLGKFASRLDDVLNYIPARLT
ncbi:MAG: cobalamin biosynthesis protein CobD, partial [Chloroflexi bacterium]|nr:cobalamin biosynthesis protein CobD [Chloroflexota bacterium]